MRLCIHETLVWLRSSSWIYGMLVLGLIALVLAMLLLVVVTHMLCALVIHMPCALVCGLVLGLCLP